MPLNFPSSKYSYSDRDLANLLNGSIRLWLPFYEESGATVNDISKYANNGTITNATWADGKLNKGISFDGTNDYIDLTSVISVPNAFTICCWWKRLGDSGGSSDSEYHMIFKAINGEANTYLVVSKSGITVKFYFEGDGNKMASNVINDVSIFNHIGATWDGSKLLVYVNGKSGAPKSVTSPIASGTTVPKIGIYATNYYNANGIIDDLRVYNKALSSKEMLALFRATDI